MTKRNEADDVHESKHAHLLKPIRDLAENWNIDIAAELLDYLEDLDEISIQIQDGQSNLNFAEAALVIQGSTLVYSKKVEFLYALVHDTLNLVEGQEKGHRKGPRQSIGSALGMDEDDFGDQEPEFLLLDDTIMTSENINLKPTSMSGNRVGLLETMPYSLASMQPGNVSNSSGLKTLSCSVHPSGALLLDNDDATRYRDTLKALAPAQSFMPHQSINPASETHARDTEVNFQYESDDGAELGGFGAEDEYDYSNSPTQSVTQHGESNHAQPRFQNDTVNQEDEEEEEFENDPWERLDPHANSSWKDRPFKKGKTFVIPVSLREDTPEQDNAEGNPNALEPKTQREVLNRVHYFPDQLGSGFALEKLGYGKLFFNEFDFVVKERIRTQRVAALAKAKRTRLKLEQSVEERRLGGIVPDDGASFHKGAADLEQLHDFDDDDGYVGCAGYDEDDDAIADYGYDSDSGARNLEFGESVLAEAPETYVDLVRSHVENYVIAANNWASNSQLHVRVREWQDRLAPVLEEQSHHPPFDIHNYGDIILTNLNVKPPPNDEQSDDGVEEGVWDFTNFAAALEDQDISVMENNHDADGSVDRRESGVSVFSTGSIDKNGMHHSLSKFEICRLFLASLQLANNGNVQLSHSVPDENADENMFATWFFKVKLLNSKLMNKELEDFRAPSVDVAERKLHNDQVVAAAASSATPIKAKRVRPSADDTPRVALKPRN